MTKCHSILVFLDYLAEQMEKQPDRDEIHLPYPSKDYVYDVYMKSVERFPDVYQSCDGTWF